MKTKLRGYEFDVDSHDVLEASKEAPQGWGRKYAVQINGRYYAPKDLMSSFIQKKTGGRILKIDFTTEDAVRTFRRLGFRIIARTGKQAVPKVKISSLAGLLSIGGNALGEADRYEE